MSYITENTIDKREARVKAAISLKEGDRVPFTPKIGMAYAQTGDISMYELYQNYGNMTEGVVKFLERYEPDLYWQAGAYPANVMEVLETSYIKWPGAFGGLPSDKGHQILDGEYMTQDEYDEFLRNPSEFMMQKIFPRKNKKLSGLSKISFSNVVEFGMFASLAPFSDPEVKDTLYTLMKAGDEVIKWLGAGAQLSQKVLEMQTPLGVIVGQNCPYDMIADNMRGYLNLPMDTFEVPDKVLASIDVMTHFALQNVRGIKQMGFEYVFIPLHGGTDDFMSNENYKKFYWPSLQILMEEIIKLGMTPYVFCEGKYNTRLEIIRDITPGKAVYMFEQVDMAQAKKILGDTVCISGNLPAASLVYGSKEEVVEETKRLIDICAPGGGFLMDCSIVLDHFKEENMDAWRQATLDFGKY